MLYLYMLSGKALPNSCQNIWTPSYKENNIGLLTHFILDTGKQVLASGGTSSRSAMFTKIKSISGFTLFWYVFLYVLSSFAIILTRKGVLAALLLLSFGCLVPV